MKKQISEIEQIEELSNRIERLEDIRRDISSLIDEAFGIFRKIEHDMNPRLKQIGARAATYCLAEFEINLNIEHRFIQSSGYSFEKALLDLREELASYEDRETPDDELDEFRRESKE